MTNTFDPYDMIANIFGVLAALGLDLLTKK